MLSSSQVTAQIKKSQGLLKKIPPIDVNYIIILNRKTKLYKKSFHNITRTIRLLRDHCRQNRPSRFPELGILCKSPWVYFRDYFLAQ